VLDAKERLQVAIDAYRALPQGKKTGTYCHALCSLCEALYYQNYAGDTREFARQLIAEAETIVARNGDAMHLAYALVSLESGKAIRAFCTRIW
jgi:hypothetical protein